MSLCLISTIKNELQYLPSIKNDSNYPSNFLINNKRYNLDISNSTYKFSYDLHTDLMEIEKIIKHDIKNLSAIFGQNQKDSKKAYSISYTVNFTKTPCQRNILNVNRHYYMSTTRRRRHIF